MNFYKNVSNSLTTFMNRLAYFAGKPYVLSIFFILVILWFVASLFIEYDTWYDIMDVFIFITTFFLLFVIQGSQNADTTAIQDKLDEIIDALPNASDKKEGEEKRIKKGGQKAG